MATTITNSSKDAAANLTVHRRSPLADLWEKLITGWIYFCGILSIIFVILIFAFVFKEALPLLQEYPIGRFLFGKEWLPISDPPSFGLIPLLLSSLLVTIGAIVIAIPLGLMSAIFIGEIASPRLRDLFKPAVELLAAIPSVVLGFFGAAILGPFLFETFHYGVSPKTLLAGSLTLAIMAIPTIATISEDAISAVPQELRQGSLGLGATRWETIRHVVLPAASSGIVAAIMLGVGRAIGETMVVLMITGNGVGASLDAMSNSPIALFTKFFPAYGEICRTITATIAGEMGEAVKGGAHYRALFLLGVVLFGITFVINLIADTALRKAQKG